MIFLNRCHKSSKAHLDYGSDTIASVVLQLKSFTKMLYLAVWPANCFKHLGKTICKFMARKVVPPPSQIVSHFDLFNAIYLCYIFRYT